MTAGDYMKNNNDIIKEVKNGSKYGDIGRAVTAAEFRGKVLTEFTYLKADLQKIHRELGKHDGQIGELEKFKDRALLVVAGAGLIGGFAWDFIKTVFR